MASSESIAERLADGNIAGSLSVVTCSCWAVLLSGIGCGCREELPIHVREDLVPGCIYRCRVDGEALPEGPPGIFPFVGLAPSDVIAFKDTAGRTRVVMVRWVYYSAEKRRYIREDTSELWEYVDLGDWQHKYVQELGVVPSPRTFTDDNEALLSLQGAERSVFVPDQYGVFPMYRVLSTEYPRFAC